MISLFKKIENMIINLIFAYTGQLSAIRKYWQYLKKLQHWNIEINIETLKSTLKHWYQHWNIEINTETLKSTLKHWNQHWNIEINIKTLKSTLTSQWVSMLIFLTWETLNQHQCQCWCRPLSWLEQWSLNVDLNTSNFFENATACSKRMRKTLVATQLLVCGLT